MIDQKNFSIGSCTLVPQIMWPSCAHDVIVDKVHYYYYYYNTNSMFTQVQSIPVMEYFITPVSVLTGS